MTEVEGVKTSLGSFEITEEGEKALAATLIQRSFKKKKKTDYNDDSDRSGQSSKSNSERKNEENLNDLTKKVEMILNEKLVNLKERKLIINENLTGRNLIKDDLVTNEKKSSRENINLNEKNSGRGILNEKIITDESKKPIANHVNTGEVAVAISNDKSNDEKQSKSDTMKYNVITSYNSERRFENLRTEQKDSINSIGNRNVGKMDFYKDDIYTKSKEKYERAIDIQREIKNKTKVELFHCKEEIESLRNDARETKKINDQLNASYLKEELKATKNVVSLVHESKKIIELKFLHEKAKNAALLSKFDAMVIGNEKLMPINEVKHKEYVDKMIVSCHETAANTTDYSEWEEDRYIKEINILQLKIEELKKSYSDLLESLEIQMVNAQIETRRVVMAFDATLKEIEKKSEDARKMKQLVAELTISLTHLSKPTLPLIENSLHFKDTKSVPFIKTSTMFSPSMLSTNMYQIKNQLNYPLLYNSVNVLSPKSRENLLKGIEYDDFVPPSTKLYETFIDEKVVEVEKNKSLTYSPLMKIKKSISSSSSLKNKEEKVLDYLIVDWKFSEGKKKRE